jgi:uncharacterized protein involved in exopolysaccharide biosynthesis
MTNYEATKQRYVTIADIINGLFQTRRRVVAVTSCSFLLVCIGFALTPRRYQSEAKLLLRLGRESVSLDATASFGPTVAMQQTRQTEVNTAKEVLASRALCEAVVDHLGAERILSSGEPSEGVARKSLLGHAKSWGKALLRIPNISQREAAIVSIQDSVLINSEDLSNIITVVAMAESPEFAQEIAEAYCKYFVDEHVRLHHTESSVEFFQEQTQQLAESLVVAREHLRDEKNRYAIGSIEGRRSALELQIGNLQTLIHSNEVDAARSRSKLERLRSQLEEQSPTVVAEVRTGVANNATDGMRQQFYALEMEERAMKEKYQDDHPLRQANTRQLNEVRAILDSQASQRTEELRKINEEHQMLSLQRQAEEVALAGFESAQGKLQIQLDKLQQEMNELNRNEAELAQVEMQVDEVNRNYQIHSERLEQARVDQELAAHQITNVRIAQPPSFQERPASPRATLTLGIGFILSCVAGMAAGLWKLFMGAELIPLEEKVKVPVEQKQIPASTQFSHSFASRRSTVIEQT